MYPPRLMKPLQATDPRVAGNSTARKSYVMPFNEYARVLSRHRSDRSGHINLFDKDLCPDRLKKSDVVDFKVQLPLYLVGNGGGDASALSTPPFVPDDIACTYDIINWVSTLDRLNRANDSPLWDGSELAGLGFVPRLIQSTMSSGSRGSQSYPRRSIPQKLTGAFSMEFADVSLVESVLSYIRVGSLSTRMILRSFCNGQCVDDAIAGISKASMKDYTLQSNNQVLPFRNPRFCELDKLIVVLGNIASTAYVWLTHVAAIKLAVTSVIPTRPNRFQSINWCGDNWFHNGAKIIYNLMRKTRSNYLMKSAFLDNSRNVLLLIDFGTEYNGD